MKKADAAAIGSDLVRGVNEHKDLIHYKDDCMYLFQLARQARSAEISHTAHANWLYGEMVLSMMKQIVEGTQDPQCWVER